MNHYEKIKMSIPKVTKLEDIDAVLLEAVKARDELSEVIELALDKQAELSAKTNDKW